jgi:hypothetical protein
VKFVLVNGRTPFRQVLCGRCSEPIGEGGYLRDIRTRLCYCRAECYATTSGNAVMPREDQAKAS